jgi:hypothetical protein
MFVFGGRSGDNAGNPYKRGRLRTVELLIKILSFCKKEKYSVCIKKAHLG